MTTERRLRPGSDLRDGRARGFTLLELLIASLCFSILLLGYTSLFRYSLDSWMGAVKRSSTSDNVNSASHAMLPIIRSAMPPFHQNVNVTMRAWDAGDALGFTQTDRVGDYLQFHTVTYTSSENSAQGRSDNNNGSDVVKMGFWLARTGATDTRLMIGYEAGKIGNYLPSIPSGITSPEEFIYRLSAFDMQFWDGVAWATWATNWQTSVGVDLPRMIRINMTQTSRTTTSHTTSMLVRPRVTTRNITL